MNDKFSLEPIKMQMLEEVKELQACNKISEKFGLYLSESQIQNLVEKRFKALRDTGRIEFGEGILKKLIYAFCDSPYVYRDEYEEMLLELQDIFYFFKNESEDRLLDDELIEFMKSTFNGIAQGSLDYLAGTSLEDLCRKERNGFEADVAEDYDDVF